MRMSAVLACLPMSRNFVDWLIELEGDNDNDVIPVVSLATSALVGRKASSGIASCCSKRDITIFTHSFPNFMIVIDRCLMLCCVVFCVDDGG